MNLWTQPFPHYLEVNFISMHTFADGLKRNGKWNILRQKSVLKEWAAGISNSVCECVNQELRWGVPRASASFTCEKYRCSKWFAQYFRKSDRAKNRIDWALSLVENFQGMQAALGWGLNYSISKPEAIWVRFARSAVLICTWLLSSQSVVTSSLR